MTLVPSQIPMSSIERTIFHTVAINRPYMDGSLQGLNVRSSSIVLVYYIGVAILYWSYFHFFFFKKKNLDSVYKFTFVKANALEILAHYSCRRSSPKFF